MILEALITTENEDGSVHLSAIGPHVDDALERWELKPFVTSETFKNLRRNNRCVIHISDDALLLAEVVTRQASVQKVEYREGVGYILLDACRSFGLVLDHWQIDGQRATAVGRTVWQQEQRPFWGWNRAKHGILELAIVATRINILSTAEIEEVMHFAKLMVEKTGGAKERLGLKMLEDFVVKQLASKHKTS